MSFVFYQIYKLSVFKFRLKLLFHLLKKFPDENDCSSEKIFMTL